MISGLDKRVFLLHNVHEEGPVLFHTRWVMSYLRGPLARGQIKRLIDEQKTAVSAEPAVASQPPPRTAVLSGAVDRGDRASDATSGTAPAPPRPRAPLAPLAPILPPELPQYFVPGRGRDPRYEARLLGLCEVHYVHPKTKREAHAEKLALSIALDERQIDLDWDEAVEIDLDERDLEKGAPREGSFGTVPDVAKRVKSYARWKKELSNHLYRSRGLDLFESATYKMTSEPLESERDFRIRLREAARERRDLEKGKLQKRYSTKIGRLEEKLRRARQTLSKESEQAKGQKLQNAISIGAALLSAVAGRKKFSLSSLSRVTTAARGFGRLSKESDDVDRAQENIEAITEDLEEMNRELESALEGIEDRFDPLTEELLLKALKPRRADVEVDLVALVWMAE